MPNEATTLKGSWRMLPGWRFSNAKDLGVGGTPTYKIGEELKFGNLSVEDLEEMIRQASS